MSDMSTAAIDRRLFRRHSVVWLLLITAEPNGHLSSADPLICSSIRPYIQSHSRLHGTNCLLADQTDALPSIHSPMHASMIHASFHSHPSIYPSVRQPIRPSNNQSNQPSIDASVCPPFRPSILPSNNPIIEQSIQLTIHLNLSAGTLTAPEHWEV